MLNFADVSIRRGTRLLFESATFNLYRGEKIGITGENGSGKCRAVDARLILSR